VDEAAIKGIVGFIQKRFELIKDFGVLDRCGAASTLVPVAAQIAALPVARGK
jgi:hypothetical protein